jgi:branched-chain amino acid transport system permease protein
MPFAQLSHTRLHYYEHGSGPERVVFIHGFEASGRIWQLVQEALPADAFHTIAIDNRGAGQSDAPTDPDDYGVRIFADDAYELLTQLGWTDFTLVGHSMGGATVAVFAIEHPELVTKLVLLNPSDPDGSPAGTGTDFEARIDGFLAHRRERLAAAPAPAAAPGEGEFLELLIADMAGAPEARLRGSLRSMVGLGLGEAVGRLPMKVLLACGDADDTIPLAAMLATYAKCPAGSGLHVWHGVGHSPNIEIPTRFMRVLRRFINLT